MGKVEEKKVRRIIEVWLPRLYHAMLSLGSAWYGRLGYLLGIVQYHSMLSVVSDTDALDIC